MRKIIIVAFLSNFRLENNKLTKLSMIINKTGKLLFSTLGEENGYFPGNWWVAASPTHYRVDCGRRWGVWSAAAAVCRFRPGCTADKDTIHLPRFVFFVIFFQLKLFCCVPTYCFISRAPTTSFMFKEQLVIAVNSDVQRFDTDRYESIYRIELPRSIRIDLIEIVSNRTRP